MNTYYIRYFFICYFICFACLFTACKQDATTPPANESLPGSLSSFDPQVRELLSQMTLDEKIGQMIQADQEHLKAPGDIATYFLGSILSGGNSDPKPGNSLGAWTDMYDTYQQQALTTRLGIPLLYGVDAVHGHNNVLGAVIFPHNIGLGATRNAELVEKIARITAKEVRATGINWTFAPCVTVPRDERWGRTYEGFAEDPELVSELGEAAVRGLQGTNLADPLSVAACVKHYVGDGGTVPVFAQNDDGQTTARLDQGDVPLDEEAFRRIHLMPYIKSINAGAATIMPSYSSWNGVKCSGNAYLMTEVLKGELGFEGFLISDYRAIDQLHPNYKTAIKLSINAGMDMGMIPSKYVEFFNNLKALVEEDSVPMSRIDDAVTRILRVKIAMGLMDPERSHRADRKLHPSFGTEAHRELARDAVRQSLVLLKNDNNTLPLSKTISRIHVAGKSADDVGAQCGGWTITWQGENGAVTPGGTTILGAVRQTLGTTANVSYTADGTGAEGADAGIVVVGESPYAEMFGDRADLALSEDDLAAISQMKAAGIPVVVVLLSGRPMILNDALEQADAFVAAWLPGTEGQGITDVLFGDHGPTGKLSFSWPRSMEQIPVNVGDADYDPLFEYGFGLAY